MKKLIGKYRSMSVQVRASFWFLVCSFMQKGISFITTPIFTRLLSTSEYGQFSVFNSWLGIITVIVTLNLFCGVYTQGLVKFEEQRNKYTSALQGLVLTLTLIWTAIYMLFRDFWNNIFSLTTVQMLAMFVMIWTSAAFSFWSVEQRVDFKYRDLVIVTAIVSLAKPVLGIIFVVLADDKVTARILGISLVNIVAFTWCFFVQVSKGRQLYNKDIWKYVLKFNLPLLPHYLSMNILGSSDRIMINSLSGESQAGIYNLAYSVSQIMVLFNTALMQTIEPWLYKKIRDRQIDDMKKVAYPTFSIIAIVNLLLIIVAPEVIAIFAPASYYEAIWVIPPVAMSVFFMFSYTYFAVFEFYFEKTKWITLATTSGAVLNIILNYFFIQLFGYMAAAYTTLICYMLFSVFHYVMMSKVCRQQFTKQPYSLKILLAIAVIFLIGGFLCMLTYKHTLIRYSILLLAVIVMFVEKRKIIIFVKEILEKKKE